MNGITSGIKFSPKETPLIVGETTRNSSGGISTQINSIPEQASHELRREPSGAPNAKLGGRSGRARNITKRGEIWYFKKMVGGKRKFLSLNTTSKDVAAARARVLVQKVVGEKWADIDGLNSKRTVATIKDVLDVFERESTGRNLNPHTVTGYCQQLKNILRKVHGADFDDNASTALLSEDLPEPGFSGCWFR